MYNVQILAYGTIFCFSSANITRRCLFLSINDRAKHCISLLNQFISSCMLYIRTQERKKEYLKKRKAKYEKEKDFTDMLFNEGKYTTYKYGTRIEPSLIVRTILFIFILNFGDLGGAINFNYCKKKICETKKQSY